MIILTACPPPPPPPPHLSCTVGALTCWRSIVTWTLTGMLLLPAKPAFSCHSGCNSTKQDTTVQRIHCYSATFRLQQYKTGYNSTTHTLLQCNLQAATVQNRIQQYNAYTATVQPSGCNSTKQDTTVQRIHCYSATFRLQQYKTGYNSTTHTLLQCNLQAATVTHRGCNHKAKNHT